MRTPIFMIERIFAFGGKENDTPFAEVGGKNACTHALSRAPATRVQEHHRSTSLCFSQAASPLLRTKVMGKFWQQIAVVLRSIESIEEGFLLSCFWVSMQNFISHFAYCFRRQNAETVFYLPNHSKSFWWLLNLKQIQCRLLVVVVLLVLLPPSCCCKS